VRLLQQARDSTERACMIMAVAGDAVCAVGKAVGVDVRQGAAAAAARHTARVSTERSCVMMASAVDATCALAAGWHARGTVIVARATKGQPC
jgi:hypothetical protein